MLWMLFLITKKTVMELQLPLWPMVQLVESSQIPLRRLKLAVILAAKAPHPTPHPHPPTPICHVNMNCKKRCHSVSGCWQEVSDVLSPLLGGTFKSHYSTIIIFGNDCGAPPPPVSGGLSLGQNPLSKSGNGCVRTAASARSSFKLKYFQ